MKISLLSLGCSKNLVDSERVLGAFVDSDLVICPHPEDAEVVVVNTCGFLEAAVDESLTTIREMVELKEKGDVRGVVVTGCLTNREGYDVLEMVPGVDAAVPFADYDRLVSVCREAAGEASTGDHREDLLTRGERIPLTPRGSAYLKISEGCNNPCTFCTIPAIRGSQVSRPEAELVREAANLALGGTREIVVVAQDTTYYGFDRDGEFGLARLLGKLAAVPGIDWVRLLYGYPAYVTDELLDVLAGDAGVLPYLDLPLQHVADSVLRRMKRPLGGAGTRRLVSRIRERVPGIVFRTTLIVGAPGEGDAEFRELRDFVSECRFERLGVFRYSREPDTPMGRDPEQVPEDVALARWHEIMEMQQGIAFADGRAQVGETLSSIVETAPEDGTARGRTWRDAPEIDGEIAIRGAPALGALGDVRVTGADGYDLEGVWIG